MVSLEGKVIVITGASSGIGKALAYEVAKHKAKIVIAARTIEKIEQIVQDLQSNGAEIIGVKADVSNEKDCENLIRQTVEKFGKIDVLINNAGISMRALFEDLDIKVLKQLMDTNFWGTVYCTKYALPYILQSKGSVVGVSSIAGYQGLPARTGYSASKFAMHGFLNTLRIENRKKGLHVLIACPYFTESNIRYTALTADGSSQGESPRNEKGLMKSEEVARKIVKAIENRKRTLIISFMGKLTVFLGKLFPAFVDKLVYNQMAKEPDSPFK